MTPASFCAWLADMKAAGFARSDAAAGRLLGFSANYVVTLKRQGTDDIRTALACSALLAGLGPYGEVEGLPVIEEKSG